MHLEYHMKKISNTFTDEDSGYKLIVLDDAQINTIFKNTNKVIDLFEFIDNTIETTPSQMFKDSIYNEFSLMRRGILAKNNGLSCRNDCC